MVLKFYERFSLCIFPTNTLSGFCVRKLKVVRFLGRVTSKRRPKSRQQLLGGTAGKERLFMISSSSLWEGEEDDRVVCYDRDRVCLNLPSVFSAGLCANKNVATHSVMSGVTDSKFCGFSASGRSLPSHLLNMTLQSNTVEEFKSIMYEVR